MYTSTVLPYPTRHTLYFNDTKLTYFNHNNLFNTVCCLHILYIFTRAQVYVDLLKLGPTSADALKLKNYRAPKSSVSSSGGRGDAGDFGSVLFSVIRDRCSATDGDRAMSVRDVNSELGALVSAHASEGRRGVERVLMGFFRRMTAVQQKWMVRVVLKDLKVGGLGQKTIMDALHPDANDLYDVNANLEKVVLVCEDMV